LIILNAIVYSPLVKYSIVKKVLIAIFFLSCKFTYSQITINDLLRYIGHIKYKNELSTKKKTSISQIEITSTIYINPNTSTSSITTFNKKGNIISSQIFNKKGSNIESYFANYDSTGTRILKNRGIKSHFRNYFFNEFVYDDSENLIEINEKDKLGNIKRKNYITNNKIGFPIEIRIEDASGVQKLGYSKEIAEYNFSEYSYHSKYISYSGKKLTSAKGFMIRPEDKMVGFKYNKNGDPIEINNTLLKYKYDKHGNWTKLIITNKKNKKIESHVRELTYRN